MSTFKYLQEEQAVDTSRFQRIRELYKEITLENTLKLLLRCKIAYDNRRRLLAVFLCHGEWERQCGKLQKLMDLDGGDNKRPFSDEEKQKILEQFAKMKRKAESLLKRLIEFTKNENKGSIAQISPKNEANQETSDKPESIRALKFKGKSMGRKVSEALQQLSQKVQEAIGSKDAVQPELNVKFSEFQSRRVAKEMIKIVNEGSTPDNVSKMTEEKDVENSMNKIMAAGKRVRIQAKTPNMDLNEDSE